MDPRNLSRVLFAASAISSLYARTNAHASPRRTTTPGPAPAPAAPALLADQALRDARLALAVVVGDVVRIVAAVPRDLALVEFAAAPIIGFDLVALAEPITSAVGIAARVKRRDKARLNPSLALAVVVCVVKPS